MTHLEYENICQAVKTGEDHAVRNEEKQLSGTILRCHHDYFDVRVGEGWQVWSRDLCEEADEQGASRTAPDYTI